MKADEESQRVILPKDLFRNHFTWCCYEKCRLPWVALAFCTLVGYWKTINIGTYYYTYKNEDLGRMIEGLPFFILSSPWYWISYSRLPGTTDLAQEVLKLDPGLDIKKWQLISTKLNSIYYRKGIWGTPYFFFDGHQAQRMFREYVLKPYLRGKFKDGNTNNEIECSKIYLQSLKETFKSNLKEKLPESVSQLPRETHKNRFLSNKEYQMVFIIWGLPSSVNLFILLITLLQRPLQRYLLLRTITSSLLTSITVCLWMYGIFGYYGYSTLTLMNISQGLKFLAIITTVAPGKDLEKWDEIARYMNQYLAEKGSADSVIFFDGKHCLQFYKKYFEPLSLGTSCLDYADLTEIVKLTQSYVG